MDASNPAVDGEFSPTTGMPSAESWSCSVVSNLKEVMMMASALRSRGRLRKKRSSWLRLRTKDGMMS